MKDPQKRYTLELVALTAVVLGAFLTLVGHASSSQAPAEDDVAGRGQPAAAAGRGAAQGRGQVQPQPDFSPKAPIVAGSVSDEQSRFILMPGYHLKPVMTEPDIMEPMQIAFDGDGRMFVLEMLSYMQDADAGGELDPISRITLHTDTNGDGVYDKTTVFVDHLSFPRFVMPFGANSILTMDSNSDDVYQYTDTNSDGVADKKTLFTSNFGRSGNVEHQQSTLRWGMDNWLYSTYNAFRVRWTPNGVLRETTGSNGAQWGVTQDNYGKMYFQGGASGLPGYFDFPIHYGNITVPDRLEPGLDIPWGSAGVGDYQGGITMVRQPDNTLARTTAGAGGEIYRGDRLPKDLIGDYLYGEVAARIVRRLRPVNTEGLNQLRNIYQIQHAEFIRTTDPLFRPVYQLTGPDGTLYIVDPYRGIIQEGNWTRPGSYLRQKVDQYQMAKNIRHGRIWQLTYDGMEPDRTMPRMNEETAAQLVTHLSHPNGWWRDTAQQLLVLKQDKSVVPQLQDLVRSSTNLFGRFQALWTLEGLNALDAGLVRQVLSDPNPDVRIQGLRVTESLFRAGNRTLEPEVRKLVTDSDTNVSIQAMLTANFLKLSDVPGLVKSAQGASSAKGVKVVGDQIVSMAAEAAVRTRAAVSPEAAASIERGRGIYGELCFTCHGTDGRGAPREGGAPGETMAPPLSGSPRVQGDRDYIIKAVMFGLTGPIDTRNFSEVMVPMGSNKDEWIADVASYVRSNLGNTATPVTPGDVARVRQETVSRKTSWTVPELLASLPVQIPTESTWKATASHNSTTAADGLNFVAWSSGTPQGPGMWYQVELPVATTVSEVRFGSTAGGTATAPTGAYGGRGRAAGAAPTGAAPAPAPAPDQAPAQGAAPAPDQAGAQGAAGPGRGRGAGPASPTSFGYPRAFQVLTSTDGVKWTTALTQGQGSGASTAAAFKPVSAKFVRIVETGTDPLPWSIERFQLFGPAEASKAPTR